MTSNDPPVHSLGMAPRAAGSARHERQAGLLEVVEASSRSRLAALVRTARPRQWVKNLLVFAAPGTAGLLTEPHVLSSAMGAFALFCLAASGTYFLNDALGVDSDRLHPLKRHRPVATGVVSVRLAEVLGAAMLIASVTLSLALAGWRLAVVLTIYAALQPLYSVWLRSVPIVDLVTVASGFVLRAVAGGVAVGVPISGWFLTVTSFGSLFLVSGKRTAEHIDLGQDRGSHRSTLDEYSLGFLHRLRSVTSSVAVAAYCLWAFERADLGPHPPWFQLSILPFVLVVLRYAALLDAGRGGSPEELVLEDRALQLLALVWVTTVAVGVHGG